MDFFKIMPIIFVLLFGIFGQRFQRHLINDNQNKLDLDMVKLNENNRDQLASDENSFEIKESNKEYKIELLQGELKFQMCTSQCNNEILVFCFDSDEPKTVPNSNRCFSNQCEVRAGFFRNSQGKVAHFFERISSNVVTIQCDIVIMKSPITRFFDVEDSSCYPKIYDGNVVKN